MNRHLRLFSIISFLSFCVISNNAQTSKLFRELNLQVDTSMYLLSRNSLIIKDQSYLYFVYDNEDEICKITVDPRPETNMHKIKLQESSDYEILDTLSPETDGLWFAKIRLINLTRGNFLSLRFAQHDSLGWQPAEEIKLQPTTSTHVSLTSNTDDLYIGEEKVFELVSNNISNIKISPDWVKSNNIDYRVSEHNGILQLHLQPHTLGRTTISVKIQTNKPRLENGQFVYELPEISQSFTVKNNRLAFLNSDKKEVTFDEKSKLTGIEIQIDNNRLLQIGKTYRIESQEERGGALIGELFTRNNLSNDKVLCIFRPYNYHRISEGYLYIKDGDDARFLTNFDITPKADIKKISILHKGGNWDETLNINPGETFSIRIEGQSLHKANFQFEDLTEISSDSSIRTDKLIEYKLRVPMNISKRQLAILNNKENTGYNLQVKEYQSPRNFDYVYIDYGDHSKRLSTMGGISFYTESIKDIRISFLTDKIDGDDKLYGVQYFSLEVKIIGPKGEILNMTTIDDLAVAPGRNSPRYAMYDQKKTVKGEILLNNYIDQKTYDLATFSKIQITFKHNKDKYNGEGLTKTIQIVPAQYTKFDIDVSFPTGLLVNKSGDKQFSNFSGVSLAMIAQFSFYKQDKVAVYKPYKIGAGFIALNAFNFNSSTDRDLGIVILGSLYPTKTDAKLSIPLYAGGGYLISQKKFFWLIGPGIQVNF
jgi:hypothetical protein